MRNLRRIFVCLAALTAGLSIHATTVSGQEGPPPPVIECSNLDVDPTSGPSGTEVTVSGNISEDCPGAASPATEGILGLDCAGEVTHPDVDTIFFDLPDSGLEFSGTFTAPTVTPPPTDDIELLLDIDVDCILNIILPPPPPPPAGEGLSEIFVYDTEQFALQVPGAEPPPPTTTPGPDTDPGDVVAATPTFTG